jgi:hypothetical protein
MFTVYVLVQELSGPKTQGENDLFPKNEKSVKKQVFTKQGNAFCS